MVGGIMDLKGMVRLPAKQELLPQSLNPIWFKGAFPNTPWILKIQREKCAMIQKAKFTFFIKHLARNV